MSSVLFRGLNPKFSYRSIVDYDEMGISQSDQSDAESVSSETLWSPAETDDLDHSFSPNKSAGALVSSPPVAAGASSEKIPHVFRWNGGGTKVSISGDFTGGKKIPMVPSGVDFVLIQPLSRASHHFKFFVDGKWQCSTEERVMTTDKGTTINTVDLTRFMTQREETIKQRKDDKDPLTRYGRVKPDLAHFTQNAPELPPHLRDIILNKSQNHEEVSASELETPHRATVNHLYCTAMRHKLMVLGTTYKYRKKCVTVVLYSIANMGMDA